MTFMLGKASRLNLAGVHPDMVRVVNRAIELSAVDFKVNEGVRTIKRQAQLVASGASETMHSRHLVGPDGFGHAVDLVALVGGQVTFDWPLYFKLAEAMQAAAKELSVTLEWGGVWDMQMDQYGDPLKASHAYVDRRHADGHQKVFIDGPHFQLPVER